MSWVYVFEFPNGKRYVGGTTQNPNDRWKNGKKYHGAVKEAIDNFGWRSITKLACWVPDSELDEQERYYIKKYKTNDPEFGYNSQSGGKKGFRFSEENKVKMSKSLTGVRNPNYGKTHQEETIRKMSEAMKLAWARKRAQKIETEVVETPQV